jgi:hypothetical protein
MGSARRHMQGNYDNTHSSSKAGESGVHYPIIQLKPYHMMIAMQCSSQQRYTVTYADPQRAVYSARIPRLECTASPDDTIVATGPVDLRLNVP